MALAPPPQFFEAGIDAITTGDHAWDRREIIPFIEKEARLVRPLNSPEHTPGNGFLWLENSSGQTLLVMHVIGTVTMSKDWINPFQTVDQFLKSLKDKPDAVLLDIHAEATSEKMAMGHHLDGRVSAVIGTHTHIPTADARILPKGTAYMTDVGMTGDYNSVIGARHDEPLQRFTGQNPQARLQPAEGEATLCGVCIETDASSMKATSITPFRYGGVL